MRRYALYRVPILVSTCLHIVEEHLPRERIKSLFLRVCLNHDSSELGLPLCSHMTARAADAVPTDGVAWEV